MQNLLLSLINALLLLASLTIWWRLLLAWRAGRPALAYRERPDIAPDAGTVLTVFVVWLIVPLGVASVLKPTAQPSLHNVRVSCISGGLSAAVMAAALFLAGGYRPRQLGIDLKPWRDDLLVGCQGWLAAYVPVMLALLATLSFRSEQTQHDFLKVLRDDPRLETVLWLIAAAVIVAPLLEELLFRVVLQGALTEYLGPTRAIMLTALAFSAVHDWPDSIPLIPLAVVLGYVYDRRHSYLAAVTLHALFNATNLAFALLSGGNAAGGH